jgi:hypothetical protein
MNPLPLPGSRWLEWLRIPWLRLGVLTGVYLAVVMVAAVLAANRVPWLEPYAVLRNSASAAVFGLVMLVPILKFRHEPVSLWLAAATALLLFALAYWMMGFFFSTLHVRLRVTPLHAFILGAGGYGFVAVAVWVWQTARQLRGAGRTK